MKKIGDQETGEQWAVFLGAGVVVCLLLLIALTAFGGWAWVASFLESGAPAWIQAIGSVAAIVAALAVVQRQHSLELLRKRDAERMEQVRRLRTLRVVFYSAAKSCESVARSIGRPHTHWPTEGAQLREVRGRLLSLDPMQIPLSKLVLVIEECLDRLQLCAKLTEELAIPRPKRVEDAVRTSLMGAARECWLGLYEATGAEAKLARREDIESDASVFDDFEESRRHLDKLRETHVKAERPGAAGGSGSDPASR